MLRVVMEGFVQMIDVDEADREFNKNLKKNSLWWWFVRDHKTKQY